MRGGGGTSSPHSCQVRSPPPRGTLGSLPSSHQQCSPLTFTLPGDRLLTLRTRQGNPARAHPCPDGCPDRPSRSALISALSRRLFIPSDSVFRSELTALGKETWTPAQWEAIPSAPAPQASASPSLGLSQLLQGSCPEVQLQSRHSFKKSLRSKTLRNRVQVKVKHC